MKAGEQDKIFIGAAEYRKQLQGAHRFHPGCQHTLNNSTALMHEAFVAHIADALYSSYLPFVLVVFSSW